VAPLHARREAFRESARNGGDLYGLSPIHPGLGSRLQLGVTGVWFRSMGRWVDGSMGRWVVGAWRPSSMKGAVVESREQVEPTDETEPVEDLEVDADQAGSVVGGLTNGPAQGHGAAAPTQGPPS